MNVSSSVKKAFLIVAVILKAVAALLSVIVLPVTSFILATAPSTTVRDFAKFGDFILFGYWSVPVMYFLSLVSSPIAISNTAVLILATLVLFIALYSLSFWIIRKISRTSTSQAIWRSIVTSIIVLELPGFIIVGIMAGSQNRSYPVYFRNIDVSPPPVVGQVSTLSIEVVAWHNESGVDFRADFLEEAGNKIHLISGVTNWHGDLIANQPIVFEMEICVTQEGSWPVELFIGSVASPLVDYETIHLDSTLEHSELIRSRNYRYSQEEAARRPTPRPFVVSVECAGK